MRRSDPRNPEWQSHVGEEPSLVEEEKEEDVVCEANGPVGHVLADHEPDTDAAGGEAPGFSDADRPPATVGGQQDWE